MSPTSVLVLVERASEAVRTLFEVEPFAATDFFPP